MICYAGEPSAAMQSMCRQEDGLVLVWVFGRIGGPHVGQLAKVLQKTAAATGWHAVCAFT